MKNIFKKSAVLLLALGALSTSCTDMLMLQSYTSVTTDYLFTTPDGIYRAGTALYVIDKEILDQSNDVPPVMRDGGTDITWNRTGGSAFCRISSLTSSSAPFGTMWTQMYSIIGKSNEIIAAAEELGIENDPLTMQGWAEAKTYRAKSYFYLIQRYPKFLLVTEPTTTENCFDIEYVAADLDEVWALINDDLQDVIDAGGLDWTPYEGQTGRFTMGTVMHIKAQAAMWLEDWDEVISLTEQIFARPEYGMMSSAYECFAAGDLNFSENLFVHQYSENTGGAMSISSAGVATGHKMGKNVNNLIARYESISESDTEWMLAMGGYGWARIYPNVSLLNMYGETDLRAIEGSGQCLFRFTQYYPDNHSTYPGVEITCPGVLTQAEWPENGAFPCLKDVDSWTRSDSPVGTVTNFKDIVVYRLAETYIMAAEAYLMKGDQANALRCYNMTYERANPGNPATSITIEDIIDEHARELCMEGLRWCFLKRLGILGERYNAYSGVTIEESDYFQTGSYRLSVTTYGEMVRGNFVEGKHEYWPIPLTQLELMSSAGSDITQVEGWE